MDFSIMALESIRGVGSTAIRPVGIRRKVTPDTICVDIHIGGWQMNRQKDYISLEISGEKLERMVSILRDKLLNEFWSNIPEGPERERIKSRLEDSILSAFEKYA